MNWMMSVEDFVNGYSYDGVNDFTVDEVVEDVGMYRNPQAKILQRTLFRNRILPNKKKDVKPEIEDV